MKYYVLKSTVNMDNSSEVCYGVMFLDDSNRREYICNVSDNYEKICELVDEMNIHNVEPYHAREIIEDFRIIR